MKKSDSNDSKKAFEQEVKKLRKENEKLKLQLQRQQENYRHSHPPPQINI